MRRLAAWLLLNPALFGAAESQEAPKEPKSSVPEASAQKDAEKLIRDVLKDDYAKKAPADRLMLVEKLIDQAGKSKDDPVARYVLLREARDIAAEAGGIDLAFKSIDEMGRSYLVEVVAQKIALLATSAKSAKAPEEFQKIAMSCLKVVEEAGQAELYDQAEKAAEQASSLAKRSKDLALASRASLRARAMADVRAKWDRSRKGFDTLQSNPEDPSAHLAVGLYESMVRGDWEKGLEHLAKGSDPVLRGLANRDLTLPTEPAEQLTLADGWWECSEKEKDVLLKEGEIKRARFWYRRAFPKLAGLSKAKVEKRMGDLLADQFGGTWIQIADPRDFGQPGKPGEPLQLPGPKEQGFFIAMLKNMPPGDFDGLMVRVRQKVDPDGFVGVFFEGDFMMVYLNSFNKSYVLFSKSNAATPWKQDRFAPAEPREEYTITVINTGEEFIHYLDGKEMFRHKARLPKIATVGFQVQSEPATLDQIRIRRKD